MHSEVLIIGGGVIGLSIARELHLQGAERITVLDKGSCGEEASWAAAGMLSPQIEADMPDIFFDLCCASRDLYPEFADALLDETGVDIELERTGTLYLGLDDDDILQMRARHEWQSKAGLAVESLSSGELTRAEPCLSANVGEALFFPNDWQVENRKLTSALMRYAWKNGIEVRENTRAGKIVIENRRAVGTRTNDGTAAADFIIVATGAWTSFIQLGDAEMPTRVEPIRGQMIAFQPPERLFRHVLCGSRGYLVPRKDGRILAGSTLENAGFDKTVSESAAAELHEMASEMTPAIRDMEFVDHWAGLRPHSSDEMPIMGAFAGIENLFLATAHYRNGILLAPLTAKLIADKIVKGMDSSYLSAFSPDRFLRRTAGTGF